MATFLQTEVSREKFFEKIFAKSHARGSLQTAKASLKIAENLAQEQYSRSLDEIISELQRVGDERPLAIFLQDFVDKLAAKNFRDINIRGYLRILRQYMKSRGLKVSEDVREEVNIPRTIEEPRIGIEKEQIHKLVMSTNNPKYQTLILFLVSSGLRIRESMSVRVEDIKFYDEGIALVDLKAGYVKGKRHPRTTFVSKECVPLLKNLIQGKQPHEKIFTDNEDADKATSTAEVWFFNLRKRHKIDEKYKNSSTSKFTFHSLRAYFETIVSDKCGHEAAHAFLGHRKYMITYYRKSENQRKQDYLSFEPFLHVLDDGINKNDLDARDSRIRDLETVLQTERREHAEILQAERRERAEIFQQTRAEIRKIIEEEFSASTNPKACKKLRNLISKIPEPAVQDLYTKGAKP